MLPATNVRTNFWKHKLALCTDYSTYTNVLEVKLHAAIVGARKINK
jgi:hypothetical protein